MGRAKLDQTDKMAPNRIRLDRPARKAGLSQLFLPNVVVQVHVTQVVVILHGKLGIKEERERIEDWADKQYNIFIRNKT